MKACEMNIYSVPGGKGENSGKGGQTELEVNTPLGGKGAIIGGTGGPQGGKGGFK